MEPQITNFPAQKLEPLWVICPEINLDLVAKPLSSPKQRQTNEYIKILVQLYFIEELNEQIDAPRLLQGLVEGTILDLPLGG